MDTAVVVAAMRPTARTKVLLAAEASIMEEFSKVFSGDLVCRRWMVELDIVFLGWDWGC